MNPLTIINERFSKAAGEYDHNAFLQQQIADELFARMGAPSCEGKILDIGIGTGYLVEKMAKQFPGIKPFGVDVAFGMLQQAVSKVSFLSCAQANASFLPFHTESFSTVVSSATYQWVENKHQAFCEAHRVLQHGGKFFCSIFGEQTLQELRFILKGITTENVAAHFISFPSADNLKQLLESAKFSDVRIHSKLHRCYFDTVHELLQWLKHIGANKTRTDAWYQGLSARKFIDRISSDYKRCYTDDGAVFATFEIIFVEATA